MPRTMKWKECAKSGDSEALAGFGVAAIALGARYRGADSGVASAAETAKAGIGRAHAVGAGGAFAGAGGDIGTNATGAGCQGASVRTDAIVVDKAFDRGAIVVQASFAQTAIGIVAAVPRHADRGTSGIGTADGTVVAIVLTADADLATHIAGTRIQRTIVDRAATLDAARDACVHAGLGTTATFARTAAVVGHGAGAEACHRAAKALAVAVPRATGALAALGIARVGWIEMRVTAVIAADISAGGIGWVGADIAAPVVAGAYPGADRILTTGLRCRIETTAIGIDQRFKADVVLCGLGLQNL